MEDLCGLKVMFCKKNMLDQYVILLLCVAFILFAAIISRIEAAFRGICT